MYNTPYDTEALRWTDLTKVQSELRRALINRTIFPLSNLNAITSPFLEANNEGVFYLPNGINTNKVIPQFNQPVVFKDIMNYDQIAIDIRSQYVYNDIAMTGKLIGRNAPADIEQQIIRAKAMKSWLTSKPKLGGDRSDKSTFMTISDLPMDVYTTWMAEGISRRYGTGLDVYPTLLALAGWYYVSLFHSSGITLSGSDYDKYARKISKTTRVPEPTVSGIISELPTLGDLKDLSDVIKDTTQADELRNLEPGVIMHILSGAWYGDRLTAAVAIQYPPVLFSLIYTAIQNPGFKKTTFGTILDRTGMRNQTADFVKSFVYRLNEE